MLSTGGVVCSIWWFPLAGALPVSRKIRILSWLQYTTLRGVWFNMRTSLIRALVINLTAQYRASQISPILDRSHRVRLHQTRIFWMIFQTSYWSYRLATKRNRELSWRKAVENRLRIKRFDDDLYGYSFYWYDYSEKAPYLFNLY